MNVCYIISHVKRAKSRAVFVLTVYFTLTNLKILRCVLYNFFNLIFGVISDILDIIFFRHLKLEDKVYGFIDFNLTF